jgi:hypothetical protein
MSFHFFLVWFPFMWAACLNLFSLVTFKIFFGSMWVWTQDFTLTLLVLWATPPTPSLFLSLCCGLNPGLCVCEANPLKPLSLSLPTYLSFHTILFHSCVPGVPRCPSFRSQQTSSGWMACSPLSPELILIWSCLDVPHWSSWQKCTVLSFTLWSSVSLGVMVCEAGRPVLSKSSSTISWNDFFCCSAVWVQTFSFICGLGSAMAQFFWAIYVLLCYWPGDNQFLPLYS